MRRQTGQQPLHCLNAARRSADSHDPVTDGRGAVWIEGQRRALVRRGSCPGSRESSCPHLGDEFLLEQGHARFHVEHRLWQDLDSSDLQGSKSGVRSPLGQGGNDDDRHRTKRHKTFQEAEPIHAGHLDIKRDNVRVQRLDFITSYQWICSCTNNLDIYFAAQKFREQLPYQRRIVDDQNLDAQCDLDVNQTIRLNRRRVRSEWLPGTFFLCRRSCFPRPSAPAS